MLDFNPCGELQIFLLSLVFASLFFKSWMQKFIIVPVRKLIKLLCILNLSIVKELSYP